MYRAFWDTIFILTGSLFTFGQVQENSTSTTTIATTTTTTTTITTTTTTTSSTTSTSTTTRVRKFIAAAVHSHFDDCPDSHSQFCFHGTCRFLILEETPACVCCSNDCQHAAKWLCSATTECNTLAQGVTLALWVCAVNMQTSWQWWRPITDSRLWPPCWCCVWWAAYCLCYSALYSIVGGDAEDAGEVTPSRVGRRSLGVF